MDSSFLSLLSLFYLDIFFFKLSLSELDNSEVIYFEYSLKSDQHLRLSTVYFNKKMCN